MARDAHAREKYHFSAEVKNVKSTASIRAITEYRNPEEWRDAEAMYRSTGRVCNRQRAWASLEGNFLDSVAPIEFRMVYAKCAKLEARNALRNAKDPAKRSRAYWKPLQSLPLFLQLAGGKNTTMISIEFFICIQLQSEFHLFFVVSICIDATFSSFNPIYTKPILFSPENVITVGKENLFPERVLNYEIDILIGREITSGYNVDPTPRYQSCYRKLGNTLDVLRWEKNSPILKHPLYSETDSNLM